jgi:hypothetical protein
MSSQIYLKNQRVFWKNSEPKINVCSGRTVSHSSVKNRLWHLHVLCSLVPAGPSALTVATSMLRGAAKFARFTDSYAPPVH